MKSYNIHRIMRDTSVMCTSFGHPCEAKLVGLGFAESYMESQSKSMGEVPSGHFTVCHRKSPDLMFVH